MPGIVYRERCAGNGNCNIGVDLYRIVYAGSVAFKTNSMVSPGNNSII